MGDEQQRYTAMTKKKTSKRINSKAKRPTKRFLGYVPVDSGQVVVVDPTYLDDWNTNDYLTVTQLSYGGGGQYMKVEKTPGDPTFAGGGFRQEAATLGFDKRGFFCVLSATGLGDGLYPVYAIEHEYGIFGRRIMGLEIRFDENEWFAPTGRVPEKVTTDSPENVEAAQQVRIRLLELVEKIRAYQPAKATGETPTEPDTGSVKDDLDALAASVIDLLDGHERVCV